MGKAAAVQQRKMKWLVSCVLLAVSTVAQEPVDYDAEMATRIPKMPSLACAGASCKENLKTACDPTKGDGSCVNEVMPETNLKCKRHTGCSMCVGDLHCGWCQTNGQCVEGYVSGPQMGNCTDWDYAFCSGEPCNSYGSCGSCSKDPMCGWCGSGNASKCMEGAKKAPVIEKCPVNHWEYERCTKKGVVIETRVVNKNDPAQVRKAAVDKKMIEAGIEPADQ